jgi:SP family xylose:H+ symportor-like MFS transporter
VICVYISEIFPNRVRARGQALGSFTHWFWAAAVSWTFPVIAEASGALAFAFFAVMMVAQFVLVSIPARDQGRVARGDPARAGHRVRRLH